MNLEHGLGAMKTRLRDGDREVFVAFLALESRLRQNIHDEKTYGNNETLRSDRASIVQELNRLALSHCKISFNDLCLDTLPSQPGNAPAQQPATSPSSSKPTEPKPSKPEPKTGPASQVDLTPQPRNAPVDNPRPHHLLWGSRNQCMGNYCVESRGMPRPVPASRRAEKPRDHKVHARMVETIAWLDSKHTGLFFDFIVFVLTLPFLRPSVGCWYQTLSAELQTGVMSRCWVLVSWQE